MRCFVPASYVRAWERGFCALLLDGDMGARIEDTAHQSAAAQFIVESAAALLFKIMERVS